MRNNTAPTTSGSPNHRTNNGSSVTTAPQQQQQQQQGSGGGGISSVQAQMQRMIELQNEQARQLQQQQQHQPPPPYIPTHNGNGDDNDDDDDLSQSTLDTLNPVVSETPLPSQQQQEGVGQGTLWMNSLKPLASSSLSYGAEGPPTRHNSLQMPHTTTPSSIMSNNNNNNNNNNNPHDGSSSPHRTASMSAKHGSHSVLLGAFVGGGDSHTNLGTTATPSLSLSRSVAHTGGLVSYGAVSSSSQEQPSPSHPQHYQQHQQQQQHYPQAQDHHEFWYSHPDAPPPPHQDDAQERHRPWWWCCLWHAISETQCRSFCFGAIDGMSTGAGILAAFWGTGLLAFSHPYYDSSSSSLETTSTTTSHVVESSSSTDPLSLAAAPPLDVALFVLAFTAAACVADAVCMAWGHVWTTRTWTRVQAVERAAWHEHVLHHTARAKAELVHALLQQRGMLKIDAMSLADTLEGYPDLLTSALLGDPLTNHHSMHSSNNNPSSALSLSAMALETAKASNATTGGPDYPPGTYPYDHYQQQHQQQQHPWQAKNPHEYMVDSQPPPPHHASNTRGDNEDEEDDEWHSVRMAVSEARRESFCMMVGFSLFALIPSTICCLQTLVAAAQEHHHQQQQQQVEQDTGKVVIADHETAATAGPLIQPETLFVLLLCLCMGSLGIWKSRFVGGGTAPQSPPPPRSPTRTEESMESSAAAAATNPWAFGLEAVAVLLVCLVTGYGMGWLLTRTWWAWWSSSSSTDPLGATLVLALVPK